MQRNVLYFTEKIADTQAETRFNKPLRGIVSFNLINHNLKAHIQSTFKLADELLYSTKLQCEFVRT